VGVGTFMFLTVDALDPSALAAFWAEVLGTEVNDSLDDGRYVFLKSDEGLPLLCFQRVPEPASGKNRLHLDVSVDDLDAATEQVLALGGSWPGGTEHQLEDFAWRTLADPEGNVFDVATG
jgi:predicted enzyme related to lactoylglutathione lyase